MTRVGQNAELNEDAPPIAAPNRGLRKGLKRWVAFGLKLALSVSLIAYLLRNVGFEQALERASDAEWPMLILATLLVVVQLVISARRWWVVLRAIGAELSFGKSVTLFYVGTFFNQAMPSAVGGDAVRMWLGHRAGLKPTEAIGSVILERIAIVVALVFLVTAMEPIILARVDDLPGQWAFPLLSVGMVAGLVVLMVLDRAPPALTRWRVVRGIAQLARDARATFLKARFAVPVFTWALLANINLSLVVYVLALGLGLDVQPTDCLALVPPVILVTTLPISIAGWGVRESAMIVAFGLIGVPEASALVLSILFGLVVTVASLPGGALWLLSADRKEARATA